MSTPEFQPSYYAGEEKIRYDWEYTKFLMDLLKEFVHAAGERRYIIGGGIAVDLTYGALQRPHEDLDIYPAEEDKEYWQTWFHQKGLQVLITVDTKPFPHAFVVFDPEGNYVADVYCVKYGKDGALSLLNIEDGTPRYDKWGEKNWNTSRQVNFEGQTLRVEDYKEVIAQKLEHETKTGESLSGKHLIDIETAKKIRTQQ